MAHSKRYKGKPEKVWQSIKPSLLILRGFMLLSSGISFVPCFAEEIQQTEIISESSHPLGVMLMTEDGVQANGFVWLKTEYGETTPVELIDGYASFSIIPSTEYELKAMLATTDGRLIEWERSFYFEPSAGTIWLHPNGLPLAILPAESEESSVRDLFCLLPDAPHDMKIVTTATDNLLKWEYTQFDSFSPVKYEVYHNDCLLSETTMQESVVSVLAGDNTYMVVAVNAKGERRYGEILTLMLESDTDGANAESGVNSGTNTKLLNSKSMGKVNVFVSDTTGTTLRAMTGETHVRDDAETFYAIIPQEYFYYLNPCDKFGRAAADAEFLKALDAIVTAKWGKKFYCVKCGDNNYGEHGIILHPNISWVHCFGLYNAPPVNHYHVMGPHKNVVPINSGISGWNIYQSFPYCITTMEEFNKKPKYWVMTEVNNVIFDIDVDSNNDGIIEYQKINYESEEDSNEAKDLGKVFLSTYHDRNSNGIIDCYENLKPVVPPANFTLFETIPTDLVALTSPQILINTQDNTGYNRLTRMHMKLADVAPASGKPAATVYFEYDESPVTGTGWGTETKEGGTYLKHVCLSDSCSRATTPCLPPGGSLRIWCKYNNIFYFIPSNARLKISSLNSVEFYIEGVKPAATSITAVFEVYGKAGYQVDPVLLKAKDIVNVTPFSIVWEPICNEVLGTLGDVSAKIVNPSNSVVGEIEYFKVSVAPDVIPDNEIKWIEKNSSSTVLMVGRNPSLSGHSGGVKSMYIDVCNYFTINGISDSAPTVGFGIGNKQEQNIFFFPKERADVFTRKTTIVTGANTILKQMLCQLKETPSLAISKPSTVIKSLYQGEDLNAIADSIYNDIKNEPKLFTSPGIPIILVPEIRNPLNGSDGAYYNIYGLYAIREGNSFITFATNGNPACSTLAHEIGHYTGMEDLDRLKNDLDFKSQNCGNQFDWGNGYYAPLTKQNYIIDQLLMGNDTESRQDSIDIPQGAINEKNVGVF